ncbi:hypothetical protein RFM99_20570 [Mesorhizobium sp. VK4C]|uniref:hypothetical protein n=1 Tax=Mesorhizobium captivum TaxID=3072319 RepID=UPI002A23E6A5|nr:hypothetical protein [Mesorhizobium sp. VK4C]MDX8500799.1 hypothetical protein [Mesorhizobium sp. VK4C]
MAKCYTIDEYELLGVEREPGKPAFALMAERGTGAMLARLSSRSIARCVNGSVTMPKNTLGRCQKE